MKLSCPLGAKCEVRDDSNNVEERCRWYTQLRGVDPQTGEAVDKWDCAIALMPILQIESSQNIRQTQAAIESVRNIFIRAMQPPGRTHIGKDSV